MRRFDLVLPVLAALIAGAGFASAQDATPEKTYSDFNAFCVEHFGAEKEPLVYEKFGKDLKTLEGGSWQHVSENSAAIAFETNLPAKGCVEYGETPGYGKRTSQPERHFYLHIHYLKGLKVEKTYHYRFVAVDERGNRITTKDDTFTTKKVPGTIHIPDDVEGPPFVLDKPDATYVVTKDLTADGTAFDVKAKDVTLDLNGHTVIYDNKHGGKIDGKFPVWVEKSSFGVRALSTPGLKLLNGTIKQGAGNDFAYSYSIGYNPVYTRGCGNVQMAGLTIQYASDQMVGVYHHWLNGDFDVHHNVFLDTSAVVRNRHGAGCSVLLYLGEKSKHKLDTHHNLVKRGRHMGLDGGDTWNNEIYIDSCQTNSMAVRGTRTARKIHHNKVFATGWGAQAFPWATRTVWHDNFVHLEGQKPDKARPRISLVGFRVTQYLGARRVYEDARYYNNVVVGTARGGSSVRGTWFFADPHIKNLVFRNNTVKINVEDQQVITGRYKEMACVVTQGLQDRTDEHLPIVYKDNTFISNICNVRFGDYYGMGSNHHFYNCKFVRIGDDPRYKTFWWRRVGKSRNHVFRDCTFEGGASFDSMSPFGRPPGEQDFTVQWTLAVRTEPGANVTITDKTGRQVFSQQADAKGLVSAPLSQYLVNAHGKTAFTPHKVKVEKRGKTAERMVTADRKQQIEIKP